ncbi:hypothetical protein WG901_19600 [Novosphingobium sp. PS1R-30]|uniref:Uncharacterized protein n=1 Tax=Novosphingobium anseongense TaxID=3133436 RepID=A0ABU8S0K1_9SPHN
MDLLYSDAVRATEAAAKLRAIVRRLEDLPLGPERELARSGARAASDLLSDSLTPPPASATEALLEVVIAGVRHILSEAKVGSVPR